MQGLQASSRGIFVSREDISTKLKDGKQLTYSILTFLPDKSDETVKFRVYDLKTLQMDEALLKPMAKFEFFFSLSPEKIDKFNIAYKLRLLRVINLK